MWIFKELMYYNLSCYINESKIIIEKEESRRKGNNLEMESD